MMGDHVECLLQVKGDIAQLNSFDHTFRSGPGPQWPDRPKAEGPRYSLHALFPVPEDVRHRGYRNAGRLWCPEYWDVEDDLREMRVRRRLGERCYRFFTPKQAPDNVILKASYDFPALRFTLCNLGPEGNIQQRRYHNGYYEGCFSPNGAGQFAAMRHEMGFTA
jgi:hypothetical protein